MRFQDMRKTVVKKTMSDQGTKKYLEVATPQRISPFIGGNAQNGVKKGIDVLYPTRNRLSRRASGMVAPRKRLRPLPSHPHASVFKAIRAVHALQTAARKRDRMDAKK